MNWLRFFRRDEADAEQRQELDFYLEITTKDYIERGMEPVAARAAAQKKLGNATLIREEVYRMNTLRFIEGALRDARHALRMIRTKPGFSVAVNPGLVRIIRRAWRASRSAPSINLSVFMR